jgi:hypothetical protein
MKFKTNFKLSTLLLIITIACVLMGLWIVPSERQRKSAMQVSRTGAFAFRDEALPEMFDFDGNYAHGNTKDIRKWHEYYLKKIDKVHFLYDNSQTIDWAGLPQLSQITALLNSDEIENLPRLIEHISSNSKLKVLNIYRRLPIGTDDYNRVVFSTNLNERDTSLIAKLGSLEVVCILVSIQKDAAIRPFKNLKNLRELDLRIKKISPEAMQTLGNLKHLEHLKLTSDGSGDFLAGDFLERLPKLKTLEVDGLFVTAKDIAQISKLDSLEKLKIRHTNLISETLSHLAHLKKLHKLDLSHNELDDSSIKVIARQTRLTSVDISSNTKVTDANILQFLELPKLEYLRLDYTDVTNEMAAKLRAKVPNVGDYGLQSSHR